MIAPEIGQPLEQRRLAGDRGVDARADLGEIDRPDARVEIALGVVVLVVALVAAHLELGDNHARRIRQIARQRRRRLRQLPQHPAARIAPDRRQITPRRQAKPRRRGQRIAGTSRHFSHHRASCASEDDTAARVQISLAAAAGDLDQGRCVLRQAQDEDIFCTPPRSRTEPPYLRHAKLNTSSS